MHSVEMNETQKTFATRGRESPLSRLKDLHKYQFAGEPKNADLPYDKNRMKDRVAQIKERVIKDVKLKDDGSIRNFLPEKINGVF